MMNTLYIIILILFVLSMVSEKISDFCKLWLSNFTVCGKVIIGDTLTKHPEDAQLEKERERRVLTVNIACGIVTAAIMKVDLIWIFNHISGETQMSLAAGWGNFRSDYLVAGHFWATVLNIAGLAAGIVMTGLFISFGSKFWHDLLDLLCQVKNAKRLLSDPKEMEKIKNEIKSKQYGNSQNKTEMGI